VNQAALAQPAGPPRSGDPMASMHVAMAHNMPMMRHLLLRWNVQFTSGLRMNDSR
jgi:hypothetical protein